MRWLYGITDSMGTSLGKFRELVLSQRGPEGCRLGSDMMGVLLY